MSGVHKNPTISFRILYPILSVDEAEYNLADIGKYGWMWLRYMEENEPSE